MNTFGSDLSKILSAREQAHAVGGVSADVPVIKAVTIKKADPEKEKTDPEKEKIEPEKEKAEREKEKTEPEKKTELEKED